MGTRLCWFEHVHCPMQWELLHNTMYVCSTGLPKRQDEADASHCTPQGCNAPPRAQPSFATWYSGLGADRADRDWGQNSAECLPYCRVSKRGGILPPSFFTTQEGEKFPQSSNVVKLCTSFPQRKKLVQSPATEWGGGIWRSSYGDPLNCGGSNELFHLRCENASDFPWA